MKVPPFFFVCMRMENNNNLRMEWEKESLKIYSHCSAQCYAVEIMLFFSLHSNWRRFSWEFLRILRMQFHFSTRKRNILKWKLMTGGWKMKNFSNNDSFAIPLQKHSISFTAIRFLFKWNRLRWEIRVPHL